MPAGAGFDMVWRFLARRFADMWGAPRKHCARIRLIRNLQNKVLEMGLTIAPEPIPLSWGPDGVIRVANTRVTLDTVVAAHRDGYTADEIARQYPTLKLADVYAIIGYFIRHRAEVEIYLLERQVQSDDVRRENESRFDPAGVRERLLARRAVRENQSDAPTAKQRKPY